MPVAVYAVERGFHRGGVAFGFGDLDLRFRRAVQLRMVNVGPRSEVSAGSVGYLLCLACGQSHSPYASAKSKQDFAEKHHARCGHRVQPTGFFADVEVDALGLHDAVDPVAAFSVVEALRMGAARVLDMETEDLQIVAIGHAGEDAIDVLLYDPMPGGSGLLEHLASRWEEVRSAALDIVEGCTSACERACIDCLQTYRNRFYHEHLDRHQAIEILRSVSGPLLEKHPIPEKLPKTSTTTGQGQTYIENRFKRLLDAAGLPAPLAQKRIELGPALHTVPDFFYEGEDDDEPGICIYLDGMSGHLHGNPETAERDEFLRRLLQQRRYEVVVVRSFELDDKAAVVAAIARIAKYLVGREKQRSLREDTSWVERASERPPAPEAGAKVLRFVRVTKPTRDAVPVFDLRVAAGAFSEGQSPEPVEHVRVEGLTPRPGHFVAQIVGDSMDEIVPKGAWCVFEHLGAGARPAAPDDLVIVRRANERDPELGEFTFKQLVRGGDAWTLMPRSGQPGHRAIVLAASDEEPIALARFVAVLSPADE